MKVSGPSNVIISGSAVLKLGTAENITVEGSIWYNRLLQKVQYTGLGNAVWSAGGALSTGRTGAGGVGKQNAALAFSGKSTYKTEAYDGTSWIEPANMNNSRCLLAGAGTQCTALAFGGCNGGAVSCTEEWDGYTTVWSNVNALNYSRYGLGGVGTQTSALAFGGIPNSEYTEEYDGISWTDRGKVGIFNPANCYLAGAGTQNAALAFGGYNATALEYDGTVWSSVSPLLTARDLLAGAGSQTAALAFGGSGANSCTEEWNGTAWSSGGALITGQRCLAGAGALNSGLAIGGNSGDTCTEEYTGVITIRCI